MKNYASLVALWAIQPAAAFIAAPTTTSFFKPMTKSLDARSTPASRLSPLAASVQNSNNNDIGGFYAPDSNNDNSFAPRGAKVGVDSRERSKYTTDSYTVRIADTSIGIK